MAQSLKLRVVAEGVETLEQLVFLQGHECDEGQGFYFSRPLAPQEFGVLLGTGISQSYGFRSTSGHFDTPSQARARSPIERPSS